MPAGPAGAPRALPRRLPRPRSLPQGKIEGIALPRIHLNPRPYPQLVKTSMGKLPIVRRSPDLKIDIAIYGIRDALHYQGLDELDHLPDVLRGPRLLRRCSESQSLHILAIGLDLLLRQRFARLPQFRSPLDDLIVHIRIITRVVHLISLILQVAPDHIKGQRSARMADMRAIVHRRSAGVHPDLARYERFKH